MNPQLKKFLIIVAIIFIAGASLAYGALTAPKQKQTPVATTSRTPEVEKPDPKPTLESEFPTINGVLLASYPKAGTDYIMGNKQFLGDNRWFAATLTYKGSDSNNRDTLRVLLEKKDNIWILRTTPPEPLLSAKKYPDVPKSILQTINRPVSLP